MKKNRFSSQDIVRIAIASVILILCSWISIPSLVPFTLQSFGVILVCLIFGKRNALFSIIIYFLLGIFGIPVFAGFRSGLSVLGGPTGGYLLGMLFMPMILSGKKARPDMHYIFLSVVSMLVIYFFGTLWYSIIYAGGKGGLTGALSICVFPYIIPDLIKCIVAVYCAEKIKKNIIL